MKKFILPLFLFALAATAAGQSKNSRNLSDRVTRASSITYSDLVNLLFTNFAEDSTPTKTIPLRHVSGDHGRVPLTGKFDIYSLEAVTIRSPQGPLVIVEFDLTIDNDFDPTNYGGEASILAAFRTSPKPRLLDALDIKTDRFTSLIEKGTAFPIGPNQDAVVIDNSHSNSSQSYEILSPYFFDRGRLKPMFFVFALGSRGCGATFDEITSFTSAPDPGNDYFKVNVTVLLKKMPDEDYCTPRKRGYRRSYRATYAWNKPARKFRLAPGGNLNLLDKFNRDGL